MDEDTQRQLSRLGPLLESTEAVQLNIFLEAIRPQISSSLCVEGIDPGGDVYMDSLKWHRFLISQAGMGVGRSPLANTRLAQYTLCAREPGNGRCSNRRRIRFRDVSSNLTIPSNNTPSPGG